jgi:hypothetical protein
MRPELWNENANNSLVFWKDGNHKQIAYQEFADEMKKRAGKNSKEA